MISSKHPLRFYRYLISYSKLLKYRNIVIISALVYIIISTLIVIKIKLKETIKDVCILGEGSSAIKIYNKLSSKYSAELIIPLRRTETALFVDDNIWIKQTTASNENITHTRSDIYNVVALNNLLKITGTHGVTYTRNIIIAETTSAYLFNLAYDLDRCLGVLFEDGTLSECRFDQTRRHYTLGDKLDRTGDIIMMFFELRAHNKIYVADQCSVVSTNPKEQLDRLIELI